MLATAQDAGAAFDGDEDTDTGEIGETVDPDVALAGDVVARRPDWWAALGAQPARRIAVAATPVTRMHARFMPCRRTARLEGWLPATPRPDVSQGAGVSSG
jgi:hypothetical protein